MEQHLSDAFIDAMKYAALAAFIWLGGNPIAMVVGFGIGGVTAHLYLAWRDRNLRTL